MEKKGILTVIVVVSLLVSLVFGFAAAWGINFREGVDVAYRCGNLLRLHIVANSNSFNDQLFKLKAKNVILDELDELFLGVEEFQSAVDILSSNKDYLEIMVQEMFLEKGVEVTVESRLGTENFPARKYGDIVLPEGNYYAYQVVIGEGQGKNWWCVLFPPLCFLQTASVMEDLLEEDRIEYRLLFLDFFQAKKYPLQVFLGSLIKRKEDNPS